MRARRLSRTRTGERERRRRLVDGSSIVSRVGDPSAAWFNPAGLTREDGAQISGSARVYERTSVNPLALPNSGGIDGAFWTKVRSA